MSQPYLLDGGHDVPHPLIDIPFVALTRRVTASEVIEAEHVPPGLRQADAQKSKGTVGLNLLLPHWVTEHHCLRATRSDLSGFGRTEDPS